MKFEQSVSRDPKHRLVVAGVAALALVALPLATASAGQDETEDPSHQIILLSPSADVGLLDSLSDDFAFVALDDRPDPDALAPLVIGHEELDIAHYRVLLREAYAAGHPVAITHAFSEEIDRLLQAVGAEPHIVEDSDHGPTPLVVLQQTRNRRQVQHGIYVMTLSRGSLRLNPHLEQWVRDRFAASQAALAPAEDAPGDAQSNLVSLGNAAICNQISQNTSTFDSAENNLAVWSARSFANGFDFYYVEQDLQYRLGAPGSVSHWTNRVFSQIDHPQINTRNNGAFPTVSISPASTSCTSSVTNSTSYSVGGNAGYRGGTKGSDEENLLNVTPVNIGMSVSKSQTVSCPATVITYQGNPSQFGLTQWEYEATDKHSNGDVFLMNNQWIWEIDWPGYEGWNGTTKTATETNFVIFSSVLTGYDGKSISYNTGNYGQLYCSAPLPFDTFELEAPVVTAVDPTSALSGQQFDIVGSAMYPSLVTAVQLGGVPLRDGNFTAVDNETITVVVPAAITKGKKIVGVQTSQGESNTDIVVTID